MTKDNEINFKYIINIIKSLILNNVMIFYYNPEKNMNVFYDKMNEKRNPFIKDIFGNTMLIKFTP